jgi:hypothetical protein
MSDRCNRLFSPFKLQDPSRPKVGRMLSLSLLCSNTKQYEEACGEQKEAEVAQNKVWGEANADTTNAERDGYSAVGWQSSHASDVNGLRGGRAPSPRTCTWAEVGPALAGRKIGRA